MSINSTSAHHYSAHSARSADAPRASLTATIALAASTTSRTDARWQADLFETRPKGSPTPDREGVSVRGAFQDALYGRALILDLREDPARVRQGRLPADLALEVRPGVDLAALAGRPALYLLIEGPAGADAAQRAAAVIEPAQLAGFDRDRPVIKLIEGGVDAWRAAGLPLVP